MILNVIKNTVPSFSLNDAQFTRRAAAARAVGDGDFHPGLTGDGEEETDLTPHAWILTQT